jgi:hypothetical protein
MCDNIIGNNRLGAGGVNVESGESAPLPLNFGQYMPIIGENHLHIHLGIGYTYSTFIPSIANNAKHSFLVRNPTGNHSHFRRWHFTTPAGPCYFTVSENPTITGDGTPVTPRNNNRPVGDNANTLVFDSPSGITSIGTGFESHLITGDKNIGGVEGTDDIELVLTPEVNYLFQIENKSGTTLLNTEFYLFFIEPDYID